jgi:hypothetical protein
MTDPYLVDIKKVQGVENGMKLFQWAEALLGLLRYSTGKKWNWSFAGGPDTLRFYVI